MALVRFQDVFVALFWFI